MHKLSCLFALLLPACAPLTFTIGGNPERNELRPVVVERGGGLAPARVAVIDVSGLIANAHAPSLLQEGENPVSLLHEKLRAAADDRRVRAVVLRLNTPGGTVTASDAMYREVVRFRRMTGKPVVALMMDVAASGGYYVACACDEVVAYPTAVTGSIGVIFQTLSFSDALGRIGIRAEAITSGPNKEAGSPLSRLTPGQREVLAGLVRDFYAQFLAVVRDARPGIPPERFDEVTDGRVMSGTEAVRAGLVDQTGDLYDAIAIAARRAGVRRPDVLMYRRPLTYVGSAYAQAPAGPAPGGTQINLAQVNLGDALAESGAGFYYLWQADTGK